MLKRQKCLDCQKTRSINCFPWTDKRKKYKRRRCYECFNERYNVSRRKYFAKKGGSRPGGVWATARRLAKQRGDRWWNVDDLAKLMPDQTKKSLQENIVRLVNRGELERKGACYRLAQPAPASRCMMSWGFRRAMV